jgi:hypothetical protein
MIHGDDPRVIQRRLLGAFAWRGRQPSVAELETVRLELSRVARKYRTHYQTETIFEADGFRILTTAASNIAADLRLIAH